MRHQTYGYLPSRRALRPLTGANIYRFVTEAHVCEQLAKGCCLKVEPTNFLAASSYALNIIPPSHTEPQRKPEPQPSTNHNNHNLTLQP